MTRIYDLNSGESSGRGKAERPRSQYKERRERKHQPPQTVDEILRQLSGRNLGEIEKYMTEAEIRGESVPSGEPSMSEVLEAYRHTMDTQRKAYECIRTTHGNERLRAIRKAWDEETLTHSDCDWLMGVTLAELDPDEVDQSVFKGFNYRKGIDYGMSPEEQPQIPTPFNSLTIPGNIRSLGPTGGQPREDEGENGRKNDREKAWPMKLGSDGSMRQLKDLLNVYDLGRREGDKGAREEFILGINDTLRHMEEDPDDQLGNIIIRNVGRQMLALVFSGLGSIDVPRKRIEELSSEFIQIRHEREAFEKWKLVSSRAVQPGSAVHNKGGAGGERRDIIQGTMAETESRLPADISDAEARAKYGPSEPEYGIDGEPAKEREGVGEGGGDKEVQECRAIQELLAPYLRAAMEKGAGISDPTNRADIVQMNRMAGLADRLRKLGLSSNYADAEVHEALKSLINTGLINGKSAKELREALDPHLKARRDEFFKRKGVTKQDWRDTLRDRILQRRDDGRERVGLREKERSFDVKRERFFDSIREAALKGAEEAEENSGSTYQWRKLLTIIEVARHGSEDAIRKLLEFTVDGKPILTVEQNKSPWLRLRDEEGRKDADRRPEDRRSHERERGAERPERPEEPVPARVEAPEALPEGITEDDVRALVWRLVWRVPKTSEVPPEFKPTLELRNAAARVLIAERGYFGAYREDTKAGKDNRWYRRWFLGDREDRQQQAEGARIALENTKNNFEAAKRGLKAGVLKDFVREKHRMYPNLTEEQLRVEALDLAKTYLLEADANVIFEHNANLRDIKRSESTFRHVREFLGRGWDWYTSRPRWQRWLISAGLAGAGAMLVPGAAVAGAVGASWKALKRTALVGSLSAAVMGAVDFAVFTPLSMLAKKKSEGEIREALAKEIEGTVGANPGNWLENQEKLMQVVGSIDKHAEETARRRRRRANIEGVARIGTALGVAYLIGSNAQTIEHWVTGAGAAETAAAGATVVGDEHTPPDAIHHAAPPNVQHPDTGGVHEGAMATPPDHGPPDAPPSHEGTGIPPELDRTPGVPAYGEPPDPAAWDAVKHPGDVYRLGGSIEARDSLWTATHEIAKSAGLSDKEWFDVLQRSHETINGQEVPYLKIGLIQPGDHLYLVQNGDHMEFRMFDLPKDGLHFDSDAGYAKYLVDHGKEVPAWLQRSVELKETAPTALHAISPAEAAANAAHGAPVGPGLLSAQHTLEQLQHTASVQALTVPEIITLQEVGQLLEGVPYDQTDAVLNQVSGVRQGLEVSGALGALSNAHEVAGLTYVENTLIGSTPYISGVDVLHKLAEDSFYHPSAKFFEVLQRTNLRQLTEALDSTDAAYAVGHPEFSGVFSAYHDKLVELIPRLEDESSRLGLSYEQATLDRLAREIVQ